MGKHASIPRTHRAKERTNTQKLSSDLLTCVISCTPWVPDTGPRTARTPCIKSLEASIYLPLGKMLPLSVLCGIHTSWASTWFAGFFSFDFCLFFKSAFTMHDCGLWCGFESTPPTHISKTLWDQYKSQIPFWGSRNKSQPQIWRFSGSSLSPLPTWKPSGHWCPFILWVSDSSYWPPRTGWAEEERTAGNWSREGRSWRCIILLFDSVVWHWLTGFLVNDRRGNKTPEPHGSSWCLINWGKPQDDNLIKKKKNTEAAHSPCPAPNFYINSAY